MSNPITRRSLLRRGAAAAALASLTRGPRLRADAPDADPSASSPAPATRPARDPAPATLPPMAPLPARDNPDATFHHAPRPLPAGAVTEDWTCFLGPNHDNVSNETDLLASFPPEGPDLVWEVKRGSGYSAPAVLGDRLVMLHRIDDDEIVDCLEAQTGKRFWRYHYPSGYIDRYGYCDGPRASPVIDPGQRADHADARVYTVGAEGKLHCLELTTGRVIWRRDLLTDFGNRQNFFGVGSTPLVEADKLIVNVGAPAGPCVAAFDLATGRQRWGADSGAVAWGPSYASPIPATLYGKRRVLVFAGGETGFHQAVTGGLLCLNPDDGKVDFTFDWRGKRRESVNASSPLVLSDPTQIFISECYGSGGVLLDIAPDLSCKADWTNENFGMHFMTPVEKAGYLYGVDGHGPTDAFLVCVERKTGKEIWRKQPEWPDVEPSPIDGSVRQTISGLYRCTLLPADGRCLCLGEYGHLLWLDLAPTGYKELSRSRLFNAEETWTGPVLSRGLLYICQNTRGAWKKTGPRLLCYDLRAEPRA